MDGSITLTASDRKIALQVFRRERAVRRALVLLLLADGRSYRMIQQVTYMGSDTIAEVKSAFRVGGVQAVVADPTAPVTPTWQAVVAEWVRTRTPQDFGFFRQRWSCAALALLLWEKRRLRVSPETVRRALRREEYVWRRPRPVLGPKDPEYDAKMRQVEQVLAKLPDHETAVFQDEVDVNLNPKIGACWMPRGQQAQVVTPGNNVKRHLAGSLLYRTGRLLVSPPGPRRNATLFVAHLDDLRRRLRRYRVVHVFCDNAAFHRGRLVQDFMKRWGHRLRMHYLPTYAPETNPIERVWWRLHETITRNHRCPTIDALLDEVYTWFEEQRWFLSSDLLPSRRAA
jgi:putative transposase